MLSRADLDEAPSESSDDFMQPTTTSSSSMARIGGLAAYIYRPERDANPDVCAVVVHQCSALGGCAAAAEDISHAVCAQGLLTVAFDLRGAGDSNGCCCMYPVPLVSGCPEVSDVVSVCAWVRDQLQRDVWIVGVSAGGPVGAGALDALPCIRGYCSIAYTFGLVTSLLWLPQTIKLVRSAKPKLMIQGDRDLFSSVGALRCWLAAARRPKTAVLVPSAGHFDLEYAPLARLDARLVAAFIRARGVSLPARLENGAAIHLSSARCCRHYFVSALICGPLVCIALIGAAVWAVACAGGRC